MTKEDDDVGVVYEDTAPLLQIARVFQCHPRTILRHLQGPGSNPSWYRAYNPDLKLTEVAKALDVPLGILKKVMNKQDSVLTAREAAATLDMSYQSFKHQVYPALIRGHKFTRWLRTRIIDEHIRRNM
jgi:hypothetical protein